MKLRVLTCLALTCAPLAAGGLGVGVQTSFDLVPGSALVPRIDFLNTTVTSTVAGPGTTINLNVTENVISASMDYNWFAGGKTGRGFYVLGGLGTATGNLSVKGTSSDGTSSSVTANSTVVYSELGVGVMFPGQLGLELVYKAYKFNTVNLPIDGGAVAWTSSGVITFAVTLRL